MCEAGPWPLGAVAHGGAGGRRPGGCAPPAGVTGTDGPDRATLLPVSTSAVIPDLTTYDWIVLNTSGGKDSQVMLDVVVAEAKAQGVTDRLVAVHCDLGRVEWEGTRELAVAQVAHYGLRMEVVARPQGDLLDHVEAHGMWPGPSTRFCTSDHKRGQVYKLLTKLCRETGIKRADRGGRRVRILNVMGLRAQESCMRSAKLPFSLDEKATNDTVREVYEWLPLHAWTEDQIWERIRETGVPHHPAYDAGMPRLSCSFCIMSPRAGLVRAAQLRPEMAQTYADVEVRIGHQFIGKPGAPGSISMVDVVAEAKATPAPVAVPNWEA